MKVLYFRTVEEQHLQQLRQQVDESLEIIHIPPDQENEAIAQAEAFDIVIGAHLPMKFLKKATNLKYYIIPFTGIPSQDRETLQEFPDLQVINLHFHSKFVAEHAWALLLASAKKLVPLHETMKGGDWTRRYERDWRGLGLAGKTLLILGYGHIGRKVAKVGKCFGLTVKAVKRTPEEAKEIDYLGTNEDLPNLLPEADFIVVTLPLTKKTREYLGEGEFNMMKPGVHIVNVGRGPVIEEDAFYEALKTGKIGGAGIDTWWNYPSDQEARSNTAPSDHPLREFDNVVFSPHRAALVQEFEKERIRDLARVLSRLTEGKDVDLVKIEEGY